MPVLPDDPAFPTSPQQSGGLTIYQYLYANAPMPPYRWTKGATGVREQMTIDHNWRREWADRTLKEWNALP